MGDFIIYILVFQVFAEISNITEYRFHSNFGQIFHDYSSNKYNAVNGNSYLSDISDTKPTDRGAYFDNKGYDCITLPPNDKFSNKLSLGNPFTIMMWAFVKNDESPFIFYRQNSADNNYFYLRRIKDDDKLAVKLKSKTYESPETLTSDKKTFVKGKF